jgi:hypothetical protein
MISENRSEVLEKPRDNREVIEKLRETTEIILGKKGKNQREVSFSFNYFGLTLSLKSNFTYET